MLSGATAAATQSLLQEPVNAAYTQLKTLLTRKLGQAGAFLVSLQRVEEKPDSASRQESLREDWESVVQAHPTLLTDGELLTAANELLVRLAQHGPPTVTAGDRGIAIGGPVSNSQIVTGDNNRNIQTGTYIERQEAGNRQIDTGGGTYIGGNAEVGGDFVGRDRK
jgi:hypothetical protein